MGLPLRSPVQTIVPVALLAKLAESSMKHAEGGTFYGSA